MTTKHLIPTGYLIIVLLLFTSCIKTLSDQLPEPPPKLVVNAAISSDSILTVNISKSIPILNNENNMTLPFVQGATINFYEDGQFLFPLQETDHGYYSKPAYKPSEGRVYSIKVDKQGFASVSAQTTIPEKVGIISFDTTIVTEEYQDYSEKIISCELKYTDDNNIENFYSLECIKSYYDPDDNYFVEHQYIFVEESEEYFYDKPYGILLWTDKLTNGQTVSIKFEIDPYYIYYQPEGNDDVSVKYTIYLKSLEEDYYQYEKSKHLYYENGDGDDPFTEPVLIYSNVENGLGVFGGFSSDTTSFNYFIDYQY